MSLASGLYVGTLRHRRFEPVERQFTYPLFMTYLDLTELDEVFARRWLWSTSRPAPFRLRRRDYLGDPKESLQESVRAFVERRTGRRPEGPIRLLTHLRTLGYSMNPVSFYYCFDPGGSRVESIVAEVTNTPWGERHHYVLDRPTTDSCPGSLHYRLSKEFHVSPFMPMEVDYDWRFTLPGEHLLVHMKNFGRGNQTFDATLRLERREITGPALARTAIGYPLMTLRVAAWIYLQAALLWLKRVPFFAHPAKRSDAGERRDEALSRGKT